MRKHSRKTTEKLSLRNSEEGIKQDSEDSPAKAEESQVEAQQSGHHMSNKGTGLTGVEVDPEPHSHQQGKQLTSHKVNLHRGRI